MKKCVVVLSMFFFALSVGAQNKMSIEECRRMAIEHNKSLKISEENVKAAQSLKKAAFTQFLPNINAIGSYRWNEKNISLLKEDAMLPIGRKGADGSFTPMPNIPIPIPVGGGDFKVLNADVDNKFAFVDGKPMPLDAQGNPFDPYKNPEHLMWKKYAFLPKDALTMDMHNIFVGGINFTQPIFLGGKILQLNNIAKSGERIAEAKALSQKEELLVNVDEAYWRVVSVQNKVNLAREYKNLIAKLDTNVSILQSEGFTTKADALKIRVKLNEAEVSLTKAENGLRLSIMALNQLIGLPLEEEIELQDSDLEKEEPIATIIPTDQALDKRTEIQMLTELANISKANEKIALSRFMPNIALSGSYLVSNPNSYNGFEKKFGGMFSVGVTATMPITHFGERIHTLRAAKSHANAAKLQIEEAKEKITLQISQKTFALAESQKKEIACRQNIENAEENLKYANEGFNEGVITSTDLLMAQTAWLSAKSDYIDALVDVRLNNVYLKKSLGTLVEE